MQKIKIAILYIAKYLGLFHLAKKLTAKKLRIICYHGFSYDDEHLFRPKLFMRKEILDSRLALLSKMQFSVISLDKAVHSLQEGHLPQSTLVITVDDGWRGVQDIARPVFAKYDFPWTLYLASYYMEKQTQVMNLALQYLCWKSPKDEVSSALLSPNLTKKHYIKAEFDDLSHELTEIGDSLESAEDRQEFVRKIAHVLNVDQDHIEHNNLFYFISRDMVKEMHEADVDIQLHTHRHTLGDTGREKVTQEIADNRTIITDICGHHPVHFCYPSGFYTPEHLVWLKGGGIMSATTCHAGLNDTHTPLLELNRFLDGEDISPIEFEAEISGFKELFRKPRLS